MRWQPIWSAPIFGRTAFRCLKPSISIGRSGAHNSFDMPMIDFWDQGWPGTKPGSRNLRQGFSIFGRRFSLFAAGWSDLPGPL
jgi:hypothetical protein